MKYGLLQTSSMNIGDEIQCLAATRFLPKIDYLIHRERTDQFKSNEPVNLIMNHWWLHCPKHFPPSSCIEPLFVSFHLKYTLRNKKFLNKNIIDYFKKYEPIGCRDKGTADFLKANGIKAYFSGCLTTTLLPNLSLKKQFINDYILCVDAPQEVVNTIKKLTNKRVVCIERHQNVCFNREQRMELAKFTLFLYHNAFCVVTIALHAGLPSTAFGTPVCMIAPENEETKSRFDGLENCFNSVKASDFIKNPSLYDINNPPANPDTYLSIRKDLVSKCKQFTSFDSEKSIFENDYNPLLNIAEIMPYNVLNINRAAYWLGRKRVTKIFIKRVLFNKDRHSLM